MKQKTAGTPLTVEQLKKTLRSYPTTKDLKDEIAKFEAKLDRKSRLQVQMMRMEIKMTIQEEFKQVENTITNFKNQIFTAIDPLLKDLETRREERELGAEQYYKTQQKLNNHEKRIARLEKTQQAT